MGNKVKAIDNKKIISPTKMAWHRLKKDKLALAGLFIVLFMIIFAVLGPVVSCYSTDTMDYSNPTIGPSLHHLMGTDELGRDILTRLMYAGRISLAVGVAAVVVEIIVGSAFGAIAGFYGGIIDGIIMRIADIFLCVPFFPILITIAALFSDLKIKSQFKVPFLMFIIGILSWPGLCRIVRGQILTLREQEFMLAANALGIKDRKKIFKHLLPNTIPSIIVSATLNIGSAILTESSLSFLGLGVVPPTPSWGNMVQSVSDLYKLEHYPWLWMPAGICILLTVMAINLLGDGLRDALDPKLKK
ncbi:peptide/nickel transport system permease protein [Clostridium acetobutylicum]|uniref:Oligopeptide transport permease protein n=1 Tax=Clostridium acetobutylicum (strain ATCC 824 / DSM 792 / JCM 1419 / IAM 19013 / LMG 5710 / NBRC 13948 / NRRL B-527 / VKM B-1787 / 2291 / W) TaxID=272562 RepID=Q97ML8_CLOAB|nr:MULTISPECIES: oligopeptide ABC transporter permease [Clostridium]AAK78160.1 Oligopeptide transport permease protein [Clostridium acetobutylicum ATCC 824]ADZ19223.1 Oligopeptide transport permease protein [Clostridium acetobutylicum EA 2018]AEI34694.1 oligopeptide transport permease protein [Clostridium acetobutylicum DSM 1731]AWV81967.1 ABC transporter permease [Clostridium acetobutylicum]MBC2395965.1 ABC transporter permease [Clostridium acetobutylicum]